MRDSAGDLHSVRCAGLAEHQAGCREHAALMVLFNRQIGLLVQPEIVGSEMDDATHGIPTTQACHLPPIDSHI